MALDLRGVAPLLNTAYEWDARPPAPDAARLGSHGDAALFFGCPDVDSAFAHLVAKGVRVAPPKVAPYGMKPVYVTDPDGYVLCLQWPVAADDRATDVRVATGAP